MFQPILNSSNLTRLWVVTQHDTTWAALTSNWTEGLFCQIPPSPLKIKLQRIRHLEAEIADMQKDIERQKEKAVAAVERLERTKKWLGIID